MTVFSSPLHAKLVDVSRSLLACHPQSPTSAHIPQLPLFAQTLMANDSVSHEVFIVSIVLLQRAGRKLPQGAKGFLFYSIFSRIATGIDHVGYALQDCIARRIDC